MANTTQRTVELNIKLSGVQTLEELEQVTSEINTELKQIPVNSKAFTEMANLAKKANSQVKEIDTNLEGVTGVQKTEALFKLGEGLAGAFAAAQGASLLFGEKTGEELNKVIAQVGGLVVALDGVKKISEAFSAENIKGLKGVVAGWRESTIAVKLFGTGTRAALTATGIGILVVLLGTIVANWDLVKKYTIKAFDALKNYVPLFYVIGKGLDTIKEKFGNLKAFIAGVGAAIKAAFTFGGPSINEAFDNAVKKSLEIQSIDKGILELTTKTKTELDNQLEIMGAQGDKQLEIYNLQIDYNKKLSDTLELKKKTGELTDDEQKLLDETIQKTKVLIVQRKKFNDDQAKAAKQRLDALDDEVSKILEEETKRKADERKKADDARIEAAKQEAEFRKQINDLEQERLSLIRDQVYSIQIDAVKGNENLLKILTDIVDLHGDILTSYTGEIVSQLFEIEYSKQLSKIEKERLEGVLLGLDSQNNALDEKYRKINSGLEYFETETEREVALLDITNQKISNENQILQTKGKIKEINDDILLGESKTKDIISIQSRGYKKVQDFVENYNKEIQAGADLVNQLFELRITQLQAEADLEQSNLDKIQSKKEEYANKEKDLNDLLADAEGERYDDILAQITANAQAIALNDAAEVESKRKITDAEYKMAKARRTQSIIDATIQGALAVIEALPNILLAAIVGGLAVASIATILAQPLPPKPEAFNQGGIVGGNSYSGDQINGKLNSGEMILNEKQQANLFKVANTGSIIPNTSSNSGGFIDYDLLASSIGKTQIFVSVKEINDVQNRLKVVESRASLGR